MPGIDVEVVVGDVHLDVDAVVGDAGGRRASYRVSRILPLVIRREEAIRSLSLPRFLYFRQTARGALAEPKAGLKHRPAGQLRIPVCMLHNSGKK